jgi:hypothetical protein
MDPNPPELYIISLSDSLIRQTYDPTHPSSNPHLSYMHSGESGCGRTTWPWHAPHFPRMRLQTRTTSITHTRGAKEHGQLQLQDSECDEVAPNVWHRETEWQSMNGIWQSVWQSMHSDAESHTIHTDYIAGHEHPGHVDVHLNGRR